MYPLKNSVVINGLLGDFWSRYENVLPHKKVVDDTQGKVLLCKIDHHLILKKNYSFFRLTFIPALAYCVHVLYDTLFFLNLEIYQ
jgi:hypothetical protein